MLLKLYLKGRVISERPANCTVNRVSDLILLNPQRWNITALRHLFSLEEVVVIKKIPIGLHESDDRLKWKFCKDGEYSVKSGYYVAKLSSQRPSHAESSNRNNKYPQMPPAEWKKVWNSKSPPKIKIFLWRAISNALAVHQLLAKKGMRIFVLCPRCGEE
uniref:Reverse transcriptase zinc-binding domain-containing protein n=1 Tax=Nelumbo nucifera TaxID=4432 RepID=A0A822ZPS2_NELNU|nr:TPA_asm: hypothetical protein HUJ06_016417 [Nelumbo nucifera]